MKSNEKFQSLFDSFLLRNVYNSKFLWCIVFLLHERHVWTFYMNFAISTQKQQIQWNRPPPPHPNPPIT